jgi:hypothetical protein
MGSQSLATPRQQIATLLVPHRLIRCCISRMAKLFAAWCRIYITSGLSRPRYCSTAYRLRGICICCCTSLYHGSKRHTRPYNAVFCYTWLIVLFGVWDGHIKRQRKKNCGLVLQSVNVQIKPLQTKRRPLYLRPQFVPRSEHFSSGL